MASTSSLRGQPTTCSLGALRERGDGSPQRHRMLGGPWPGSWTGRFCHFPAGPFKSLLFPHSAPSNPICQKGSVLSRVGFLS